MHTLKRIIYMYLLSKNRFFFLSIKIYPMNPNMMQPPHNGMMNMQQQPGPQYINQQVKNYYFVFIYFMK